MTNVKHTPGPWIVSGLPAMYDEAVNAVGSDGPLCVARLPRTGQIGSRYKDEVDANARLIASAPDLLAALRVMVGDDPTPNIGGIAMARAAIARAEGGAR